MVQGDGTRGSTHIQLTLDGLTLVQACKFKEQGNKTGQRCQVSFNSQEMESTYITKLITSKDSLTVRIIAPLVFFLNLISAPSTTMRFGFAGKPINRTVQF